MPTGGVLASVPSVTPLNFLVDLLVGAVIFVVVMVVAAVLMALLQAVLPTGGPAAEGARPDAPEAEAEPPAPGSAGG